MGVKIKTALSLEKSAAIKLPRRSEFTNIKKPLPFENFAIFTAAQLKNPISSNIKDKIIIPIKVNVASHTISITSIISPILTAFSKKATTAIKTAL